MIPLVEPASSPVQARLARSMGAHDLAARRVWETVPIGLGWLAIFLAAGKV